MRWLFVLALFPACAALRPAQGVPTAAAPAAPAAAARVTRRRAGEVAFGAAFGAALPTAAFAAVPVGGFPEVTVEAPTAKVDINRAQGAEYKTCPGMYPTIAGRIVEHVRYNGRFNNLKEVLDSEDIIQGNPNIKAAIEKNKARFTFS